MNDSTVTRDHRTLQLRADGFLPDGDPECAFCRGTGTTGKVRADDTSRPCVCVRRAMADIKGAR